MEIPVESNVGKKEEKQLRIAIYETPDKIIEGGYGDFYNTLDRKTAIEKMQKAIFPLAHKLHGDDSVFNDCYFIAQAALNALLGE